MKPGGRLFFVHSLDKTIFLCFLFLFLFLFFFWGGGSPYVLSVVSFAPKDVLLTAQCICLAELLYLMAGQGTPT